MFYAIELPVILKMKSKDIVRTAREPIVKANARSLTWCAGSRVKPPIHPWEQQELPDPTSHWIDVQADKPLKAYVVPGGLSASLPVRLLAVKGPAGGRHVFLFAPQPN